MISNEPLAPMSLVVFGDLLREEVPRIQPFLNFLAQWDSPLEVWLLELDKRSRVLPFDDWVDLAQKRGWKSLFFLPFVRAQDLPWLGAGAVSGVPVYFIRNPGIQDVGSYLGGIEEFLTTEVGLNYQGESLNPVPVRYHFGKQLLVGDTSLLEKVPFLQDYLSRTLNLEDRQPFESDADYILQLKAELSEKELTIKRLIRSEKRYKKFFEDDITGDFVMDLNYRVIDCNRSFARIFGFPSIDYALGYDIRHLFPTREARIATVRSFLQLQCLDYYEMEMVRPDGQTVHIIGNLLGIKSEDGRLFQVRGFLFDNTPRKHLEQQLRESQKMEGLGRLAGGIAHDFNNLLTVINGYAELLLSEMEMGNPLSAELGEILKAGIRASELTSQLLAFSRRQVLSPKVLNLNSVIKSLETMLHRLMSENIFLDLVLEEGLPTIRADKGQLDQVVLNLALNARDAMPAGGRLRIQTMKVILETSTYGGAEFLLPGTYSVLKVSDTGIGMDEETQKRIFEPFFTTKTPGKGTGLGLAMVYGIVRQSGGALKVDSQLGSGTSFTVYFDALVDSVSSPLEPSKVEMPALVRTGEAIVLVEDELMVREYAFKILTRYGYKVKSFSHGREALSYLLTPGTQWDLIVTDVVMPVMVGPEMISELEKNGRETKVLYLSGYTDDEILRHGIFSHQVEFLHKPFKAKDLLGRVREIIDN